jgi:hypothetical protein
MGILSGVDRERARRRLSGLASPVTLVHFTMDYDCPYTRRTLAVLEEVAGLADSIRLTVHDFAAERETADRFGVDHVPATVITGGPEFGLRFDGLPEGAEFERFLDGIMMVSRGDAGPGDRLAVLASPPTRELVHREW